MGTAQLQTARKLAHKVSLGLSATAERRVVGVGRDVMSIMYPTKTRAGTPVKAYPLLLDMYITTKL